MNWRATGELFTGLSLVDMTMDIEIRQSRIPAVVQRPIPLDAPTLGLPLDVVRNLLVDCHSMSPDRESLELAFRLELSIVRLTETFHVGLPVAPRPPADLPPVNGPPDRAGRPGLSGLPESLIVHSA